tara:strand:- start:500 stop:880 length:381 start_codon:yes stop_codon:yes gene_type:complete
MINKNKEVLKILEENKITNFHTPEDKIRMEIDKKIEVDDRGPSDLTRKIEETDKRLKELDTSLSIALELNDTYQRDNKKLNEQLDRSNKESADLKYDNKSLAKQVEDKVEEVKALKIKLELLDNKS